MLRSGLVKWVSAAPIKERCLQYIPVSLLLKLFFLVWGVPALKTVKEEPPLWKKEASGVCVMARRALCGSAVFTKEINYVKTHAKNNMAEAFDLLSEHSDQGLNPTCNQEAV